MMLIIELPLKFGKWVSAIRDSLVTKAMLDKQ